MALGDQIRQFVNETFDTVTERSHGNEIAIICPEPSCGDRSGNRSINVKTGLTSCWRCGKGGPFVAWAKRLGHVVDFTVETTSALSSDELGNLIDSIDSIGVLGKPSGYIPSVELPRGFIPVGNEPDSAYYKLIARMAARKNLDIADLIAAGVGFTRTSRRWEPFAIFPVFEWGRPVYYQGHTYLDPGRDPETGKKGSTKQFPTKEECPLSSKYWVYNLDEVRDCGGIVIAVESIMNVLSLKKELRYRGMTGYVPVAVFKHKVSAQQHTKLLQAFRLAREAGHPVTEICFMYDGRTHDEVDRGKTGDATITAGRDAEMFVNNLPTSIVDLPDEVDPNDNAKIAVDMLLTRVRYNQLNRLTFL